MTAKKPPKDDKVQHKATPSELAALEAYCARSKAAKPAPRIKVSKREKIAEVSLDHPDQALGHVLLAQSLGIADGHFLTGLLRQLANAGTQGGEVVEEAVNFMLSVVQGMEPKDHLEVMLIAQMTAVHMATMKLAPQLNNANTLQHQDSAARTFTQLLRTFVSQMETFKRYRTGGQQKVTVEHVTVNEGGQAIVASNVTHGGNGAADKLKHPRHSPTSERPPCRPLKQSRFRLVCDVDQSSNEQSSAQHRPNAFLPSLRGQNTLRETVRIAGRPWQETLPDAWRRFGIRRTARQSQCPETWKLYP